MTQQELHALYDEGDRVVIDRAVWTSVPLPSYCGSIIKVVSCYAEGCVGYNVRLDDDPRTARSWFFYEDQMRRERR